jgi:type II secretory pathway component PulJ
MKRGIVQHIARDERGISVVELAIASALSLVILLSLLMTLDTGTKTERGQQARNEAMLDLRQTMGRITKDTRQALSLSTASTRNKIDMVTFVSGARERVVFELAAGSITRKTCDASTITACTLPTTGYRLATNVTGTNPFCYDPPICALSAPLAHPRSVRISIALEPAAFSGGPITLATDVKLRNI